MKIGVIHHNNEQKEKVRLAIHSRSDHDVLWGTNYGLHALEHCRTQKPDLILLDVYVMEYDGISFVQELITKVQCPVLLLTDDLEATSTWVFEAMAHGALDVAEYRPHQEDQLIRKLQQLSLLIHPDSSHRKERSDDSSEGYDLSHRLICFGASTGGPLALASILSSFPQKFAASIVIVQHVEEAFCEDLAKWLSQRSLLPVEIVTSETAIKNGKVYLSDSKSHLVVNRAQKLVYKTPSQTDVYRPSIDIFFDSVAQNWKRPGVAALLTGMGSDGAKGLKKLKEKGWMTIAEAESSCVVYGMPKAAVESKAATDVMNLTQIPLAILSHLKRDCGVAL